MQDTNDYIDHKVSGAWTQLETETEINAKTSTEGARYRNSGATDYAYSLYSDVGSSGGISNIYWGAFRYDYESLYDWSMNDGDEDISDQDIVGGFYMDDSSPTANTVQQTNVYYHVDT